MGQSVEVVVSELDSAATRLADAGQRLQDGLSGVDLEVGQLLGSGWKGGAASAFGTEWEKWHSGAGQVVRGLQTMSQWLTVAAKEYAKTDEQAAGALGSSMRGSDGSGTPAAGGGGAAWQSAGAQPGVGELAAQMNLTEPAGTAQPAVAAMSPLGQAFPAVGQAVQGTAGQSVQAAAGLAQQAGGLAQQVAQLVQQAAEAAEEDAETRDGDMAQSADATGSAAPVQGPTSEPSPSGRALAPSVDRER
uniref:WXG100 family type VII secretion target n=2 Tax=unclassified Mycobacterium TaxID=2642494 RepID=A0A5Q5BGX4_MYCSS